MLCSTSLEPDLVIVRWLHVDRICTREWRRLVALLDKPECEKAEQFVFAADRDSYIASHALTRLVLSSLASVPPAALRFAADGYGKPQIAVPLTARRLQFSLSHTRGLVAVSVTMDRNVGVDIELIDEDRLSLDLAEQFLAAAEITYLRGVPEVARAGSAMAVWTLKEAYLKAIGKGLSYPLNAFVVIPNELAFRNDECLTDNASAWLLHSLRIAPQFVLGLAARHRRDETLRIDASEVTTADILW